MGLLVGVVIGVSGTFLYANGAFDELLKKQSIIPTSTLLKASTQQVAPATEPTTEATKAPATEVTTEATSEENIPAPTEQTTVEPTEATTQPEVEQPAEQTAEQPATEQVVEPATEQIAEKPIKNNAEPTVQPFKEGHSYLVWGLYRKLGNAKKAIKTLAEKYPHMETNLHRYGASYMLTIYECDSRAECNKQMSAWQKEYKGFGGVWVFTR